ncbi:MAG TPA: hypothetical protein VN812_05710 [Candidatus Acidoferrales bacterium]|nr:hypothetical protein [Candidatus Acidoferrales bacterium]
MNRPCDTFEALDTFPDDGESLYRIVLRVGDIRRAPHQIRQVVGRARGDLRRLTEGTRRQPLQISLRLGARHIDDVVTALEAAGFDVGAVVATRERAAVPD